jgi:photosystem II stability/assembly factor-like uncharacterized protein
MPESYGKETLLGVILAIATIVTVNCALLYPSEKFSRDMGTERQNINLLSNRFEQVSELPTQDQYCPDGFQFVHENYGWIFCNGNLWRTSDSGKSWENIYVDSSGEYAEFKFINSQIGWKHTRSMLLKTENGGHTWVTVKDAPIKPEKGVIGSVSLLDNGKQGWIAGGVFESISQRQVEKIENQYYFGENNSALKRAIFHTTDSGKTWQKQPIKTQVGSEFSLYISKQGQVWAWSHTELFHQKREQWEKIDFEKSSCANQYLKETATKGNTLGDFYGIVTIYFTDSIHGWLSFENGFLAKTTDGGQTWCDLLKPRALQEKANERIFFREIYFTDSNTGWGLTSGGQLYETKDGGTIWLKIESSIQFSSMYFLDSQHGWVISKEGLFRILL